jgi:hypothetical protein
VGMNFIDIIDIGVAPNATEQIKSTQLVCVFHAFSMPAKPIIINVWDTNKEVFWSVTTRFRIFNIYLKQKV